MKKEVDAPLSMHESSCPKHNLIFSFYQLPSNIFVHSKSEKPVPLLRTP